MLDHVDATCAATTEIVFELFGRMGIDPSNEAATCMYTAIASGYRRLQIQQYHITTHIITSEFA